MLNRELLHRDENNKVICGYIIPVIMEYCVIINVYNGEFFIYIPEAIMYSLFDIIVLLYLMLLKTCNYKIYFYELLITIICFLTHLQWYVHNPFEEWPEWWPAEKSETDERHRTEWYDTHVMIFVLYMLMIMKRIRIQN